MRSWIVVSMAAGVLAAVISCSPSETGPATTSQATGSSPTPVSNGAGTVRTQAQPVIHMLEETARVPAPAPGQKKVVLEQLGMT